MHTLFEHCWRNYTIVRSKFTPQDKARIILESLNTNISTAELCRKYNISPPTFYQWKEKFVEGGKTSLNRTSKGDVYKSLKKENESLKRLIGELTVANDILKKRWRASKDDRSNRNEKQGHQFEQVVVFFRSIKSKMVLFQKTQEHFAQPSNCWNSAKVGASRPTYGTRRMAATLSRKLGRTVNRKQIQRIYRSLGWIEPAKSKNEITRSHKKIPRPTAPNQLWQTDMTYVWCGIDG